MWQHVSVIAEEGGEDRKTLTPAILVNQKAPGSVREEIKEDPRHRI